jgi:hypothetical protein
VEGVPPAALAVDGEALPDVREVDGVVHSSLPLGAVLDGGVLEVRRLRQIVTAGGELREALHADRLDVVDAETLESEARHSGLRIRERIEVGGGEAHVGSTVVVCEAE